MQIKCSGFQVSRQAGRPLRKWGWICGYAEVRYQPKVVVELQHLERLAQRQFAQGGFDLRPVTHDDDGYIIEFQIFFLRGGDFNACDGGHAGSTVSK